MATYDALLRLISKKSRVRVVPGNYRGVEDDGRALVDFDGGRVPAYTTGPLPALNAGVWVQVVDDVPFMLGVTDPQPSRGTVVSASSGSASVSTDTGTITARYATGALSPTTSDIVALVWSGGSAFIVAIVGASSSEVPGAPGSGAGKVTRSFSAVDSGSYQSGYGWRTNDLWSSLNNQCAWFYGSKIKDTIPDAATILSAQIYLPAPSQVLGSSSFGRHGSSGKPAGAVSFSDTGTLAGNSGWVSIPTALLEHLKANTGGLGFASTGTYSIYNIWPGTQKDGQSGTVRVTYR